MEVLLHGLCVWVRFSIDNDFDSVYCNFLIYKTLILFREKDLELRVAASGAQDPEKSVRVLGILMYSISYSDSSNAAAGGGREKIFGGV